MALGIPGMAFESKEIAGENYDNLDQRVAELRPARSNPVHAVARRLVSSTRAVGLSVMSSSSLEDILQTLGGFFIGFVLTIILYGFTFFQTYVYFTRYPKDSVWIKLMVGTLCALDTATSALISQAAYYYFIEQFMTPVGLLDATATFCIENGLAVLVVFIVQIYYSVRIFEVNGRSPFLPFITSAISLIAFGLGVTMTVQIFNQQRLTEAASFQMKVVAGVSQGCAALADIIIVVALCYALQPSRNPRMRLPEGRFEEFFTFFINRGICFTIVQLAYMCVFVATPTKQFWIPFQMVASKLYINSLLLMLNTRALVHGRGIHEEQSVASSHRSTAGMSSSAGTAKSGAPIRFNVDDSKIQQSISIGVSHTVDTDQGESSKGTYDDDHSAIHEYIDDGRKQNELVLEHA
jgi:hypothetical protein